MEPFDIGDGGSNVHTTPLPDLLIRTSGVSGPTR